MERLEVDERFELLEGDGVFAHSGGLINYFSLKNDQHLFVKS